MPNPPRRRLILDCSALLPGPLAGKLLAQQGARVLKIESPERPDPAREMGNGIYYRDLNALKELIWISLIEPEGRARFHELVRQADGLIEGFRPQAKLKLGLDEATLHAVNPKLCILSLVGFPEDGPSRDRAGHDINFQALTGCLSLFEELPGLPLADLLSAYEGALSLSCAIDLASRQNGRGKRCVVSMTDTLKGAQSKFAAEYRETRDLPIHGQTLITGRHPSYQIYRSRDGKRIAVGALESKFWHRVCDILALPALRDLGQSTGEISKLAQSQVQAALALQDWAHWAPLFEAADCCVDPVLDYSEVFKDGI